MMDSLPAPRACRSAGYWMSSGTNCAMRSTQPLSITRPNEMAEAVEAKVARGAYASESEVVREGLRAPMERDRAVETWLHEQVVPAAIELARDPSRGLTPSDVRERSAQARRARAHGRKA